MGRNLLALNVMWKYLEQVFPCIGAILFLLFLILDGTDAFNIKYIRNAVDFSLYLIHLFGISRFSVVKLTIMTVRELW